ncbi:MAG: EAL domain-containing protein [Gammaproteobacteria bacterium]|nr:MAG: EAL domain-containing protein [Gammaproteobacteria bacterium]
MGRERDNMPFSRVKAMKILIIDDEKEMIESERALLERPEYELHAALGGIEALARLESEHFDLLLLDMKMPDLDGFQLLDILSDRWPDIQVIVVSGEDSFDAVSHALHRGANDFIKKPYAPKELITIVENAYQRWKLEGINARISQHIRESEKLHRFIVDHSPDFIYVLDHEGKFIYVNDRVKPMLGYEKEDLIGQHFSVLLSEEDLDKFSYFVAERRTGERMTRNVEIRLRRKPDEERRDDRYRDFENDMIPIELNAMGVYNEESDENVPGEKGFHGTYGVARDISERKSAEATIQYQAYHDLLTGLPNRALLEDRIRVAVMQSKRIKTMVAVLFLDLDAFKKINDSLGHSIGDSFLKAMANRLKACLREGDTLARFGGDEFVVVLPYARNEANVSLVAEKLLSQLRKPVEIDGQELFVTGSIGIALCPGDGQTMDDLIKHADIAMYAAKAAGKNCFHYCSEAMNAKHVNHLSMEQGLHRALKNNELLIEYQPQVDIESYQIVAMEALLRWEHPDYGRLSPSEFIPLAEESGLIIQIGEWVIIEACRQIREWRDMGRQDIRVSVNLSALQLHQENIVETVQQALQKAQLPGDALEIELTESVLMQDMDDAKRKLDRLNATGVKVAIDDFGTGYSSLAYIHELPVHTLKIDQGFVQRMNRNAADNSVIAAIIAMAEGLNLDLIAEGVETEEQLQQLKEMGCKNMQGFLYSRPLPKQAAAELLAANDEDARFRVIQSVAG